MMNQRKDTTRFFFWLIAGIAFLLTPLLIGSINPRAYESAWSDSDEAVRVRNSSAMAQMFGQFRTGVSDILFIQTEAHLHGGVKYFAHSHVHENEETASGALEAEELKDGEPDEHEGHESHVKTFIPPPEEDWRGFIGVLDREINPWLHPSEEHHLSSAEGVLPLYKLAVLANPNNVKAYRVGTYWLQTLNTRSGMEEALKFAQEGVDNNPDNFVLYKTLGVIQRRLGMDDEALKNFKKAIEMGEAKRPPEGMESPRWDEDREEELEASMRYAVYVLEKERRYDEAIELIKHANSFLDTAGLFTVAQTRIEKKQSGELPPEEGMTNDALLFVDKEEKK